jgi:hypothetical protein
MADQLFAQGYDEQLIPQPTTATGALIDFMPSDGPAGETVQPGCADRADHCVPEALPRTDGKLDPRVGQA